MNTYSSSSSSTASQRGSSLVIVLIAVALFAALSYALSRQGEGTRTLSLEKIRLVASDMIDMGNSLADATARLRLRNIADTKISFENSVVAGYTNATCTVGTCKVFDFSGGGKDWETPSTDINGGVNIGITGDLAIKNIGSSSADLVMVVPAISSDVCSKINVLLGLHNAATVPSTVASAVAAKFTGTYAVAPVLLTSSQIDGQKSGCLTITNASGTAFTGSPFTGGTRVFYQVLLAR